MNKLIYSIIAASALAVLPAQASVLSLTVSNPLGVAEVGNVGYADGNGGVAFADLAAGMYSGNDTGNNGTALDYLNGLLIQDPNDTTSPYNLISANGSAPIFGDGNWVLNSKSDSNPLELVTAANGSIQGDWSFLNNMSISGDFALGVKSSSGYSLYMFEDVSDVTNGWFNTSGTVNNGGNQPALSHLSLFTNSSTSISPSNPPPAVPEPSTYAMFGMAFGMFAFMGYRARKSKS